jgi:3,4-dihydroxy 2-butanone 4-phosphate synthase/GTP cyclohydrolase II
MTLITVDEAVQALRSGRLIVLWDETEDTGMVCSSAEKVTAEQINMMVRYARGLITVPTEGELLDQLGLPTMIAREDSSSEEQYTISVDSRNGNTTGISASDRAATIRAIADPQTEPEDLVRPGHVFPIRCIRGGVLARSCSSQASVDLVRLTGFQPVGVVCAILREDGGMARIQDLREFADRHGLGLLPISSLIEHRCHYEKLVERVTETGLPTRYGDFTVIAYRGLLDADEYVALVRGSIAGQVPILVIHHQECTVGEVFGSKGCRCQEIVRQGLTAIDRDGRGIFIYFPTSRVSTHITSGVDERRELRPDYTVDGVEQRLSLEKPRGWDMVITRQILCDLGVKDARLLGDGVEQRFSLEKPQEPTLLSNA